MNKEPENLAGAEVDFIEKSKSVNQKEKTCKRNNTKDFAKKRG